MQAPQVKRITGELLTTRVACHSAKVLLHAAVQKHMSSILPMQAPRLMHVTGELY